MSALVRHMDVTLERKSRDRRISELALMRVVATEFGKRVLSVQYTLFFFFFWYKEDVGPHS